MTVPDEAVVAAWEAFCDGKDDMLAALEAAAPFIAAQALANAVSYAEDQAMAGAYFPDWQNCADKIRTIPNPYRSGT